MKNKCTYFFSIIQNRPHKIFYKIKIKIYLKAQPSAADAKTTFPCCGEKYKSESSAVSIAVLH